MENLTIRDGFERMDFECVTRMLSQSYWCPGIKIEEVKKGALNSALVVGAFVDGQKQIGYAGPSPTRQDSPIFSTSMLMSRTGGRGSVRR